MGKEKRSAADAEARSNYLAAKKQAELEQEKKEKQQTIIIAVCIALVAILMISVITYNKVSDSGYFLRREVAAESENYTVDGAMMTYFFYTNYQQYSSLASYLGVDTSKSLKSQASAFSSGTWFDYFMGNTRTYVNEVLALCEAAKANNVTLDEADEASVEESLDMLRAAAKARGYTVSQYLVTSFGANIKEKDVRHCLELTALASKYANEYNDSLSYTLQDCEAYYSENQDSFDGVDVMTYTVSRADFMETDEDGNVTGDSDAAQASAKEYADKLAAAASADEFKSVVKDYIVNVLGEEEEHADEHVNELLVEHALKTDSAVSDVADWAFSASAGETTTYTEDETVYVVYYLVAEAYRDETPTRNVRHILFATDSYESEEEAKAAAEAAYAEWEAAGFTEDKFVSLCEQYSNDTGSNTVGGLYEEVKPGDMVTEFNDWTFDSARAAGDHDLIETSYGWHIMSYVGESDVTVWQANAESALASDAYTALVDEYAAGNTFYTNVMNSINA